jgi:hypothetical protein
MSPLFIVIVCALAWSPTAQIAATSPAPAAMAPSPAPTIRPVQWQGVTLGEDIEVVRARLGTPEFNRKVILGSMLVEYPLHGGEGTLLLETTERQVTSIRVEAAAPKDLSLPIGDPFGVNLGDSLMRLLAVRGDPTRSDEDGPDDSNSIYGSSSENRWTYSIHSGIVVGITLIAPKPQPVYTGPSRPGLTLRGTPPPRKGIVIKGTPVPVVAGATAKPVSTPVPGVALSTPKPVPTPSPTPVPGVALATSAPPQPTAGPARPRPAPSPSASPSQTAMLPPSGSTAMPSAPPGAASSAPTEATPSASATPTADGSSVKTAIVVRAPDQATGFDYIYKFIENIGCGDGSAQYRVVDQSISSENRHNYAKVIGECPTTHDKRAFYFDITYIFTRSER